MRRDTRYDETDKAALMEAMARAWLAAAHPGANLPPAGVGTYPSALIARCANLHAGRIQPASDGDHAALAILAPVPDDGDPVTEADREAMEACPVCGGAKGWNEGAGYGHSQWVTCPPPPDGCGGTGRRSGGGGE